MGSILDLVCDKSKSKRINGLMQLRSYLAQRWCPGELESRVDTISGLLFNATKRGKCEERCLAMDSIGTIFYLLWSISWDKRQLLLQSLQAVSAWSDSKFLPVDAFAYYLNEALPLAGILVVIFGISDIGERLFQRSLRIFHKILSIEKEEDYSDLIRAVCMICFIVSDTDDTLELMAFLMNIASESAFLWIWIVKTKALYFLLSLGRTVVQENLSAMSSTVFPFFFRVGTNNQECVVALSCWTFLLSSVSDVLEDNSFMEGMLKRLSGFLYEDDILIRCAAGEAISFIFDTCCSNGIMEITSTDILDGLLERMKEIEKNMGETLRKSQKDRGQQRSEFRTFLKIMDVRIFIVFCRWSDSSKLTSR